MKAEAKLIVVFLALFLFTLVFYRQEPTSQESSDQEARSAGLLLHTSAL